MMIGTSEKSGGGISSVIRIIKKMPVWKKYKCYWLGTQIQANKVRKLLIFVKATLIAPVVIYKYDIIHFHIVPGITLLIQLPELLLAKLYRKKIIAEVHIGNQLLRYSDNKLFRWWLKRCDLILLLAVRWKNLFYDKYSEVNTPVDVLYNACDLNPSIPFADKRKLIIFAGVLDENKAPQLLIRAWAKIASKHPDWKVSFMGNGNIEGCKVLAEELGVEKSTEFTGYITGHEKDVRFHDASVLCLCSYVEGFPMVVLEAWSNSIAVITTPVGGLPDVIEEEKNCLTFPFGDVDELSRQLDRMLSDNNLRRDISELGYKYVQSHFSLNIINDKLDGIYQKLLKD